MTILFVYGTLLSPTVWFNVTNVPCSNIDSIHEMQLKNDDKNSSNAVTDTIPVLRIQGFIKGYSRRALQNRYYPGLIRTYNEDDVTNVDVIFLNEKVLENQYKGVDDVVKRLDLFEGSEYTKHLIPVNIPLRNFYQLTQSEDNHNCQIPQFVTQILTKPHITVPEFTKEETKQATETTKITAETASYLTVPATGYIWTYSTEDVLPYDWDFQGFVKNRLGEVGYDIPDAREN
ncbi:hypothetical protein BKA69DRAFT_1124977 [Paraphysoderma sedebokerense]|nr:hypothetical protein BKA69DRAFT_1124977 [Paraphysoderma sedebokerense]